RLLHSFPTRRSSDLGPTIAVHRVTWPDGLKDANAFFSSRSAEDFAALLKAANPPTEPVNASEQRLGKEAIELTADGFRVSYGERSEEHTSELQSQSN